MPPVTRRVGRLASPPAGRRLSDPWACRELRQAWVAAGTRSLCRCLLGLCCPAGLLCLYRWGGVGGGGLRWRRGSVRSCRPRLRDPGLHVLAIHPQRPQLGPQKGDEPAPVVAVEPLQALDLLLHRLLFGGQSADEVLVAQLGSSIEFLGLRLGIGRDLLGP